MAFGYSLKAGGFISDFREQIGEIIMHQGRPTTDDREKFFSVVCSTYILIEDTYGSRAWSTVGVCLMPTFVVV